ncbi:MAG: hypothetical protein WB817_15800 [Terriglobales bacterium]
MSMILLVSEIERRRECAAALEQALREPVLIAEGLLQSLSRIRGETYTAVVFDDKVTESEPGEMEMALTHLGTAIPVYVNLAIVGTERLIREVRAALRRRKQEEAAAREAAAREVRGDFNRAVTTLLLDCEMAIETKGLPAGAAERLALVHDAARKIRAQLEEVEGSRAEI